MQDGLSLVLLGPPGAGKSTQAGQLACRLGIQHISTGDLLREEVAAGTPLGRAAGRHVAEGRLVPDELVLQLVRRRLGESSEGGGFVLDGFPRSLPQAQALDSILARLRRPLTLALLLWMPDEVAMERLRNRLACPDCGGTFHLGFRPPQPGTICPACRMVLESTAQGRVRCRGCRRPIEPRPDDEPGVLHARLEAYHRETDPLLAHYRAQRLLREVDAVASEAEAFERILGVLSQAPTRPAGVACSQAPTPGTGAGRKV